LQTDTFERLRLGLGLSEMTSASQPKHNAANASCHLLVTTYKSFAALFWLFLFCVIPWRQKSANKINLGSCSCFSELNQILAQMLSLHAV